MPVEDVSRFETEFLEHVRRDGSVLAAIRDTGKLSDEDEERLNKTVSEFKQQFATESGDGVEDDGGTGELATGDDSSDESSEGSSEESSESAQSSDGNSDESSDGSDDSSNEKSDGSEGSDENADSGARS